MSFIFKVRQLDCKTELLSDDLQATQAHEFQRTGDFITNLTLLKISEKIKSIARLIHNAKKHVRGSKTSDLLMKASQNMDSLLKIMEIDSSRLYERTTHVSRSVCPEVYMGTAYGAPFFYKGFETETCNKSVHVWKLVTIISYIKDKDNNRQFYEKNLDKFLLSTYKLNVYFEIMLGLDLSRISFNIKSRYQNLTIIDSKDRPLGNVINDLVNKVNTPYVLIAKNVEFLSSDARLERLVREIEQLHVPVAGGAFRTEDGHWKKGCFQSVFRNFTLRYLEGYDVSLHECIFCDFIQGPFVTTKEYLTKNKFTSLNENEGMFEDWFLRNSQTNKEFIICPDSMFHVHLEDEKEHNWDKFMSEWNIFRSVTPLGYPIVRKCSSFKYDLKPSKVVPLCSLQYVADAIKTIMNLCEKAGIVCELQEGTALGAVKLGKILPWERDADLTFLTANYTAFLKLKKTFKQKYFAFSDFDKRWCCVDNITAGGQFKLRYKGWNIELYGQHEMDSQLLIKNGMKPTQVLLDGQWVNVPRNPGLFVRNRYGREIYQHAEHWMTTGDKSGWINYKTNVFKSCIIRGDHDCLDRYNADGDLSFTVVIP